MENIEHEVSEIIGEATQKTEKVIKIDDCTDTANAEMIAELYGDKIRYDHKLKRWLLWNGVMWKPDDNGSIYNFVKEAAKKRLIDATEIKDTQQKKKAIDWALKSESRMGIEATLGLLKNTKPIADNGKNWDKDTMLLSCPNGIIDLTTGKLRLGKPEDRITMSTNIEFDPRAECNRWEQFQDEIFDNNDELIHFIKKAAGYSITGSTREQCAFICYGSGQNGKGIFFKTIEKILGDYAYDAPASLFQRNPMATNSNDVAATEAKRFLVSSENLSSSKINEQRLKGWTGGDKVTARYLYSEFYSFEPTVKPWIFTNHKPGVDDNSHGFWRRIRLIPFEQKFEGERDDKDLETKLCLELPGILRWLVEGCLMWQQEGLKPIPSIVKAETKNYQIENDVLAEFIFDKCELDQKHETKAMPLYKSYTSWSFMQGLAQKDVLSIQAFGRLMSDKFTKRVTNEGKIYVGIRVKGDDYPSPSSHEVTDKPSKLVNYSYIPSQGDFTKNDPISVTQAQNTEISVTEDDLSEVEETYVQQAEMEGL